MYFSKQPTRRIRARLGQLLIFSSIFLATLAVCAAILALFFMRGIRLLSPLQKQEQPADSESLAVQTKTLCLEDHLICTAVEPLGTNAIHMIVGGGIEVFLSTAKDIGEQLASLQQVMSQLTIKGKQLKKLDFRFDHLVVTY